MFCCDACGQAGQPMLRCTRCQSAYYHDAVCQKQHWSIHRKTCSRTTSGRRTAAEGDSSPLPYRIATRSEGNSLVASRKIPKGETFGIFKPLVPPVLHAKHRRSHCAWCFVVVDFDDKNASILPILSLDTHPVLACSEACQTALSAPTSLFRCEAEAIRTLERNGCGPPGYFPTALLVYRLAAAVALQQLSVEDLLLLSIGNGSPTPANNDAALAHELAVLKTAHLLLDASSFPWPPTEHAAAELDLRQFLSRIKINSVSIWEVGFGIFRLAHLVNHSCQPNSDQAFFERRGMVPTLHLTCCASIEAHDEITVSYLDKGQAREVRQAALASQYGFHCTCLKCTEDTDT